MRNDGAGSRTERQPRRTTKRKRKAGTVSGTEGWGKRKRYQEPCREMEEGGGNGQGAAERNRERRDGQEEGRGQWDTE